MRKIDLQAEKEFENSKVLSDEVRQEQRKFYWSTHLSTQEHREKTLKEIKGLQGIEIGCSYGSEAVEYTKHCLKYTGIDISDEAIKEANLKGIPNANFICTDGHLLPFEDSSQDFVIVNSLLHHLDLDITFPEISRVLNSGGKLIFKEPLGTNPLFQTYRYFTPNSRTDDERPFTFSDLKLMKKYFDFEDVRWYGFLVILSAFYRVNFLRKFLNKLDNLISHSPLRYFFWQFSGIAIKRK